jgi:hypothetical protein
LRAEEKMGFAWNGILAGDIDNLDEYVDEQMWGKQ